jgi:hypothetical protein
MAVAGDVLTVIDPAAAPPASARSTGDPVEPVACRDLVDLNTSRTFKQEQPRDTRPRDAIDIGRSWIRGEDRPTTLTEPLVEGRAKQGSVTSARW